MALVPEMRIYRKSFTNRVQQYSMTTLGWERLNIYGKVAVLNTVLGLVLFVAVEGTRYPYEGVVFLGIAALTVTVAIYRNSSKGDPEQYPQDREDGASEREKKRQKEMEGEKGRASGESL